LQVTGFAAGRTVIGAVFAQAYLVEALAQHAVFIAGAGTFRQVADAAYEFFGHSGRLSRFGYSGNGTMVDDLAMDGELVLDSRSSGFIDPGKHGC
jgi:hypothetical protein